MNNKLNHDSRKRYRSLGKPAMTAGLVTACAALLFSLAAVAESEESDDLVLEEVMVTATKRDTTLQDTGIAISVLDADEMQFRDITNMEDMENAVPGLKIGTVLGTPLINIRGVGLNFISGLGNPGVATHYDGIYLPRPGSIGAASVDVAQVEVLRGPQGTLYGRNATGGSVNFQSKRPEHTTRAGATVGGGDYGREFYEGELEGSLDGETVAMRVYLRRDHFDGYGINETTGHSMGNNDTKEGHWGLSYQPNDALDVYLSYTRREDEGDYPYSTALTTVTPVLGGPEYPLEEQSFKPYNIKGLRQPFSNKITEIGNLTIDWRGGGYSLKSITGFVGHDRHEELSAPELERFVIYLHRNESTNARSQEFNLSNNEWFDGRLNWLVGVYYQIEEGATPAGALISIDELIPVNTGSAVVFPPESKITDTTRAMFLDGYWSLQEDLRLVFGVRLSDEKRKLVQTFLPYFTEPSDNSPQTALLLDALKTQLSSFLVTCDAIPSTLHFSSTDPKLGVEWEITEDVMAYVLYQTGFKAGGFDTSTGCSEDYEPEEIESYEIGVKSTLMDGKLTLNAAAFYYDYKDYQVDKVDGFESIIENAAKATSQGFELETSYTPVHWFTLDAQYSYLDATYDEYITQDNFKNINVIVGGAPDEDLSGNSLSRSPKHSLNMGLNFTYNINQYHLGYLRFRIEGFYSDKVYFREFNEPMDRQDSYSTYGAFLSLYSEDDKYSLSVFGKNLGDERYLVGIVPFDTVRYRGGYYAPPRTWGASVTARY